LTDIRGDWIAFGSSYRAAFTAEGFRFTPVLGDRASKTRSLSFRLEAIRRGDRVLLEAAGEGARPVREGLSVRYARGAGIVEAYEVRPEGVEQSFRFEALLPGEGDLVVRGRVETELPPLPGEEGGALRFEEEGLGGVSYGGVTGIDAAGRRVPGRIRLDGSHLELSLPAEFVASAAYPLVLDPIIGTTITIATGGTFDHFDPDVAYDATNDVYLVVWERSLSGTDIDILGQRVSSSGALVGPVIPIDVGLTVPANPTVANANATDMFLVAYETLYLGLPPHLNIVGKTVAAATGTVSGPADISYLPTNDRNADAGGDPRIGSPGSFEDVFVVWKEEPNGIRGRVVHCPSSGPPTMPGGVQVFSTQTTDDYPSISKSCGQAGRWLVAWNRYGSGDILARVVDASGALCTPETPISVGPAEDEYPAVAGDGNGFLVAWQRGPDGGRDVLARTAAFSGSCGASGSLSTGPELVVEGDPGDDEVSPTVDLAPSKYILVWADPEGTATWDVYMKSLDPGTGAACEPATAVHTSPSFEGSPEVATQFGAGSAGDQALVAFHSATNPLLTDSDLLAHLLEAIGPGGPVVSLGGGCGGGGTAWVNGPVALGNSSFALTLSGADPGATGSVVLLGVSSAPSSCGPCTLVPDLSASALLFAPLSGGAGNLAVPIPCDLALLSGGAKVQWIVFFTGASPCPPAPGFSLSNAIDATVGL
jgi:hypothetical protein